MSQLMFHMKKSSVVAAVYFLTKPKESNGLEDRLILSKTFRVSNGAYSLIIRNISCNQVRQSAIIWMLNQTQIVVHSSSQHSSTWWSVEMFVRKEAGLRAQHRILCNWTLYSELWAIALLGGTFTIPEMCYTELWVNILMGGFYKVSSCFCRRFFFTLSFLGVSSLQQKFGKLEEKHI